MEEIKDYLSQVDTVHKFLQGTSENQEQIGITSIANALSLSWDSKACVFGIANAMPELVNLGYCKGYEENGHYRSISRSPGAPTIQPSECPVSIDERLPLRRSALEFVHGKTVCREFGITFYNHNIGIAVKDAPHKLLPTGSDSEAAVVELSASIQYLVNSGLVAGVPFPHNNSLRPVELLPNEIDMYVEKREIFPPEMYFRDPSFLAKITATGELKLWITLRGAICLNRTTS